MAATGLKFSHLALATLSAIVTLVMVSPNAAAQALNGASVPLRLEDRRDARPAIAIVIDDVGLDWARFRSVNALPIPLTMAFLPYGADAQAMLDATDARHEPILHLPMEPNRRKYDAGPDMVPAGSPQVIKATLNANFAKLTGYQGVNNHTGSKATADARTMQVVLAELGRRDLYFLDSRTTDYAKAKSLSRRTGTPVVEAQLFLDGNFGKGGKAHVEKQLRLLTRLARTNGSAIAIGHPYPETLSAIMAWAEDNTDEFRFVTAGDLVKAAQSADDQS